MAVSNYAYGVGALSVPCQARTQLAVFWLDTAELPSSKRFTWRRQNDVAWLLECQLVTPLYTLSYVAVLFGHTVQSILIVLTDHLNCRVIPLSCHTQW